MIIRSPKHSRRSYILLKFFYSLFLTGPLIFHTAEWPPSKYNRMAITQPYAVPDFVEIQCSGALSSSWLKRVKTTGATGCLEKQCCGNCRSFPSSFWCIVTSCRLEQSTGLITLMQSTCSAQQAGRTQQPLAINSGIKGSEDGVRQYWREW